MTNLMLDTHFISMIINLKAPYELSPELCKHQPRTSDIEHGEHAKDFLCPASFVQWPEGNIRI